MSILKIQTTTKRQIVKMSLDITIYQQIQSYCKWANLERPGEFVERAAEYIFMKDDKWKNRNRSTKKSVPAVGKIAQQSTPQATQKKPGSTSRAKPSRKTTKTKPQSKHITT